MLLRSLLRDEEVYVCSIRVDPTSIQTISVGELQFDHHNPQLPRRLDASNEAAVLEWMLEDATILELMGSIGEQGYFAGEPLLVVPAGEGLATVVEGNRRLAAVKLLRRPELAPVRKKAVRTVSDAAKVKPDDLHELPAVVYHGREDILSYLGYRHITGIKAWNPLAKARYLADLLPTVGEGTSAERYRAAAREIGSRADYVQRLLTGLAVYNEIAEENSFFKIPKLDEESLDFSLVTTALGYTAIIEFLGLQDDMETELEGLDTGRLRELMTWMFEENDQGETRLGESRNLRQLSAIVGNERALAAFRGHSSLETAYVLTSGPSNAFTSALLAARTSLQAARDSVYLVDMPAEADLDVVREVQVLARDLAATIRNRLDEAADGGVL